MTSAIDRGRNDLLAWEAAQPKNYFLEDADLQSTLRVRLGAARFEKERASLERVGALVANELRALSREVNVDENLPRLERFSGLGVRTEEVVFHPSYHAIGRAIWETGLLAKYAEPGNEVVQIAMSYLFAHDGENGHMCPLACTAGLIKVLMALGTPEQKARVLPGLSTTRYDERLHASQFLTEVQGGSDVGANAVVAKRDGDRFRIFGEKWFCSVADATVFLMTARPEGAPAGTKGLGLFLVPRTIEGRPNGFSIRRLKRKLGTRAMASAEIDFDGALAEPIGPLDRGFKSVVEHVLDTSRIANAASCMGTIRRAYLEASSYARHRRAFGSAIGEYPLVQEAVATLRMEAIATSAATFRLAVTTDPAARRVGVNVNKYWTSVRNTQMIRLAMEVLGGNGTIETFSILPQLYRDAMVLESWEGTHNTLVAQMLRDAERLELDRSFTAELSESLDRIAIAARDRELVGHVRAGIGTLVALRENVDQRFGKRILDQMAVVQAAVALLEELAFDPGNGAKRAALEMLVTRDVKTQLEPPQALDPSLC